MPVCQECKNYFAREDEEGVGDCVTRVIDPRQAYWRAKPVEGEMDSSMCKTFQKKE